MYFVSHFLVSIMAFYPVLVAGRLIGSDTRLSWRVLSAANFVMAAAVSVLLVCWIWS